MSKLIPAVRNGLDITASCPINAQCQCALGGKRKTRQAVRCGYFIGLRADDKGLHVRCGIGPGGTTFN